MNDDPDTCRETVATALELGYRHVDTASIYGNESAVGDGLEAADVPREDVTVATKLWIDDLAADDVRQAAQESLDRLGVDYVDLLYVHWPAGAYEGRPTIKAVADIVDDGIAVGAGVSNFRPEQLEVASEVLGDRLVAHQIELHPLLQQEFHQRLAQQLGLTIVAYCPLVRGDVFDVSEIVDIGDEYGMSPAAVSLAWHSSLECVIPIPKATGTDHLRENLAAKDIELAADAINRIDQLDRTRRVVSPEFAPW